MARQDQVSLVDDHRVDEADPADGAREVVDLGGGVHARVARVSLELPDRDPLDAGTRDDLLRYLFRRPTPSPCVAGATESMARRPWRTRKCCLASRGSACRPAWCDAANARSNTYRATKGMGRRRFLIDYRYRFDSPTGRRAIFQAPRSQTRSFSTALALAMPSAAMLRGP